MRNSFIAALFSAMFMMCGCGSVESYESGFFVRWGEIINEKPLGEGLYFYNPFATTLECYDCRNKVISVNTSVFTKDIQTADVSVAVTYSLQRDKVIDIHRSTGRDFEQSLVSPAVLGAVKNAVGQMEAEGIISKRKEVAENVTATLNEKLGHHGFTIVQVEVLDIGYSDVFERAVEEKQVALQKSIKEKNETARLREVAAQEIVKAEADAKAKIVSAEAEAKAMLVKAESEAKSIEMRNKALSSSHALIEYEAVRNWDGKLPAQMLGNAPVPFIKIGGAE